MEEDLKIIEELIEEYELIDYRFGNMLEVKQTNAIEHLVQAYKQQADIIKNSVSKDKIIEILDNKFVVFYAGDAEFPDDATEINKVKYINAKHLQELLEGDE